MRKVGFLSSPSSRNQGDMEVCAEKGKRKMRIFSALRLLTQDTKSWRTSRLLNAALLG